jgi:hypothetical protein
MHVQEGLLSLRHQCLRLHPSCFSAYSRSSERFHEPQRLGLCLWRLLRLLRLPLSLGLRRRARQRRLRAWQSHRLSRP